MMRWMANPFARFVAVVAVGLQSLLPSALAAAEATGVDVSRYLCATPGLELSAEAKAAAADLAQLLGEEDEQRAGLSGTCLLCTLVYAAPLPEPVLLDVPARFEVLAAFNPYDPGLIPEIRGAPLGSRGPPSHF